ncbi:phage tail tape measure protein [Brevibacterium casei]|uniref:phage tail tape measure protein n=1 Tax=Brevibacterium casei TaxID=33889 RepID=UPI0021AF5E84|nr:phage tail tape measure protein [Brevibacterium casei]MCT2182835.1 phage tail tape measure protein [Brevibacterium casei]
MAVSRSVSVVLSAKVNQFKADMAAAGKSAVDAARETETAWDKSATGAGKAMAAIGRYEQEMTTAGTAMATFGGVVVGSLGLATKAAMSWESAWTGVLKTVDGSPKQLAEVEKGLRGLAKTLPASHEEIAAVAEAAGQLGIKTDAVVSFTKTMIDMGESTNLSAEEASTALAQFMNIMGTSQKNVGKLGAAIVGLGNDGASTESQIVDMAMRLAGAGKQANLTEGDVLGLASALANVGIDAEAGGTAMSMVMKKIGNEVANGGGKLDEFARIAGMSSEQFSTAWEQDAGGAINAFVLGLGNAQASGENVNKTLTDLGITGIRESDALLRLSASGDNLTNALKRGNDEYERGKALAEEAAKRYETAESKIRIAGNSLKDTAITIGGTFLPAVASVAEGAAQLATAFGDLPEPVIKVGAALGGVVGAAALAGGAALILVPKIAETVTAVSALKTASAASTGTLGKFSGALAGLGPAAAGAAVGLTALSISKQLADNGLGDLEEVRETVVQLSQLKSEGKLTAGALDEIFTASGSAVFGISSFGKALEATSESGWREGLAEGITLFGLFGDTTEDVANKQISQFDSALAAIAQSGDAEVLQQSFQVAASEAENLGYSAEQLIEKLPELQAALVAQATSWGLSTDNATLAKIALGEISGPAGEAAAAVGGVGGAANDAAGGLKEMLDGLLALGLATLSERDAMRMYEEAVDGVSESIKENGTTLDITTQKGRDNQAAFDAIAESGFRAAQSMAENEASQEQVQGQLQRTYDDLIATAGQFGVTGKKAEDMAREVMGIPDEANVKTWMDDAARKEANKTEGAVKDIPKNVKINVSFNVTEPENGIKNMPENLLNPNRNKSKKPGSLGRDSRLFPNHDGSILTPMAAGGFTGAEMVPPNTWRVVGDRMDVDEAYVPLDGSRRSWEILLEALNRMPGAIPMAKGGIASAQKQVDSANDRLRDARRMKSDAKSARAKAIAERRVRSAEDELATAKRSLKSAKDREKSEEKAAKLAADRAKEEQARRERVSGLQSDLRTDLRRGSIRDQVTGGLSGGYSAVDRLFGLGSNEDLSRGSRSRANSSARKFEANLRSLYGQAERIDAKLKAAQDKAQELKGIKDSVVNSLLNGRDLDVGTFSTNVGGKWVTGSNLGQAAKSLRVDVGAMKAFAGKLKKLVQLGVPGAIVQEIAQAGVVEGSNMADSFIDATAADRKSYLGAWAEYEKYANQAGQYVTEGFYKGGSAAADGVVKGLEGRKKSVESAIANLAKAMESTFKSVLGIRSPSTVMAELGGFTAEGLVQGMLGGVTDVQSAAAILGAAAVPSDMSFAVSATPVVADDEGQAGLAMQDMSTTTLDAMSQMQTAVSEGFAGMLANTQAAQAGMLADTQTNQTGMLTATQTSNASMLVNTQTQQEAMRLAVATKQLEARTAATTEQEAMRLMLLDKQSQMKTQSATDFESMRLTTSTKLGDMRRGADTTMLGMHGDQSTRLDSMKATNKAGFESMLSTSNANMRAIRSGMDAEMSGAKPELGSNLNKLISVFASFTASVNKAFGEVGVKLNAPSPLKFETGGVMPGYTPGRDVHEFYSPTAGNLYLSGGEAIMRPEWTRAMGGEAGVKAQNDAARAGRLDDLLHMQTGGEAFASGGVYGPVPGVNAFADAGVWRGLWGIIKSKFPSATLNSAYRGGATTVSGNKSYHSRGMAVDLGGPMRQIFDFLYNNYRNSSEIIYSPAGGRQIKNGQPYTYSGAVRKIHWNHVHWANRSVPGGAGSDMTPGAFTGGDDFMPPSHPFLDRAGVSAGSNLEKSYQQAAQKLTAQIYAKHAKLLPSGIAGQLGKGIMSQISEGLVKKAADYGKSQTFVMPGGSGVERWRDTVIQALKRVGLPTSDDYVNAWLRQIKSESGGNPSIRQQVRDVNSGGNEAMGLVQVIPGTFAAFRDKSLPNDRTHPLANLVAGMNWAKYKASRRGWNMLDFIGKGHGYEDGTKNAKRGLAIVGESGPELVNFQGGEQVLSNPESMRFMAANRTYVPTQGGMQFDQAAFTRAVADAVTANGVSPESIAAAMNGVRFTLKAGQHEFDAAVVTAVGTGYDQSVSRRSKSSQKIGAI